MSQEVEILLKARNVTGQTFKEVQGDLAKTATQAKNLGAGFASSTAKAGEFADGVGRVSTTLARSVGVMGLSADAFRNLDDASDIVELGLKNLSQSAAGFNAASLGVAGAGLAVGAAIGGWLRTFPAVAKAADDAAAALVRLFTAQKDVDKQANNVSGLKAFAEQIGKIDAAAHQMQIQSMGGFDIWAKGAIAAKEKTQLLEEASALAGIRIKNIDEARALLKVRDDGKAAAEAMKQLAIEAKKAKEALFDALGKEHTRLSMEAEEAGLKAYDDELDRAAKAMSDLGAEADKAQLEEMAKDAKQAADELAKSYEMAAGELADLGKKGTTVGSSLKEAMANLPQTILGAIQGGGNVGGAIGASLGGAIGKGLEGMATKGLSSILGKTLGGALGSVIPGLGALLGEGLGKFAGKLFGKIFHSEVKEVNDLRDAFLSAHGGFEALAKQLAQSGQQGLVQKIFDTKTVKDFKAAVGEVMSVLGLQTEAQEDLQKAIEKYGFTVDQLGPKFRQQELDKQAGDLFRDYQLLIASGIDMNLVLEKMGPNFEEYVKTVIKGGGTIPEALRPVIDAMIANGELVDENGKAYASAEEAGIHFAESMSEQFKSLIEHIEDLVAALTGIPNIHRSVTIDTGNGGNGGGGHGNQDRGENAAHGAIVLPFRPRAMAGGGFIQARPGGELIRAGEGGDTEMVAPLKAFAREVGAAAAAAAGAGGVVHAHLHVDGRELAQTVIRLNRAGALPIDESSVGRR